MNARFLLHCCCAPCGIAVIDELRREYDLAVLFYNPNIFPEDEYFRRKSEVIRVCREWGIPMIDQDYDAGRWERAVRGLEREPEGGIRCGVCFRERLFKAAEVASQKGFGIFGTTLTSGRQKPADLINRIGAEAGKRSGVDYHPENWKKRGREERGRRMVAERGIYRQNYCGCRYSLRDQDAGKPGNKG